MLEKFGIEIRKIGTVSNLYRDVDTILAISSIKSGDVSRIVQAQACAHSLQSMLRTERHFSVSTVRNCAAMCQVQISKQRMDVYSSVHCMDYSEMTQEFRQTIVAMVLDDFRGVLMQ